MKKAIAYAMAVGLLLPALTAKSWAMTDPETAPVSITVNGHVLASLVAGLDPEGDEAAAAPLVLLQNPAGARKGVPDENRTKPMDLAFGEGAAIRVETTWRQLALIFQSVAHPAT